MHLLKGQCTTDLGPVFSHKSLLTLKKYECPPKILPGTIKGVPRPHLCAPPTVNTAPPTVNSAPPTVTRLLLL
jgi:hypothetical protein